MPRHLALPLALVTVLTALTHRTDPQSLGVTGTTGGRPKPGGRTVWEPSAGAVSMTSGDADNSGFAVAVWTLSGVPGPITLTATAVDHQVSLVIFGATALPLATVAGAYTATDRQIGLVGTELSQPLKVRVLCEGAPSPGGGVSRTGALNSVTAGMGYATVRPTLPVVASLIAAQVSSPGVTGPQRSSPSRRWPARQRPCTSSAETGRQCPPIVPRRCCSASGSRTSLATRPTL